MIALPVRIPQATGRIFASPRQLPADPGQYTCDVDHDGEQLVIREPDFEGARRRALVLWQIGEGRRKRRAAGLL